MRAQHHKRLNHQRGDTIIEVLISITVVSSVLGITFATMNRNLQITRALQERTEASKYAESQLEALKVYTDSNTVTPGGSFCLDGIIRVPLGATPAATAAAESFAIYPALCVQQSIYHLGIVPQPIPKLYRVYVRWDKVGGGGREEVVMSYRVSN